MLKITKAFLAILLSAAITACGGGGGSSSDSSNDTNNNASNNSTTVTVGSSSNSINVSWTVPNTRANNESLNSNEIQGYVVIVVSESDIAMAQSQASVFVNAPTLEEFLADPQLANYISNEDIAMLVETGSPNAFLVSSPDITNLQLTGMDDGTYYIAVSAFDYDGLYSDLSDTVIKTAP